MDASLSEEQVILRDTVEQLATDLAPAGVHELPAEGAGAEAWQELAGVGLLGLCIPERFGGVELSGVEVVLSAEELSRRLVPLPFVGSAVSCSSLLVSAGAAREILESMCAGSLRFALALDPGLGQLARPGSDGIAWETRGAAAALAIDPDSRKLVALRMGATPLGGVDLTRELRPVAAKSELLDVGDLGGPIAGPDLERWHALTLAALCADLVGVMRAALDAAVDHVASREQFGVPVGSFQAVQHLAAEAKVSLEAARGLAWYAGWAVDALAPREALAAARTAKAYCSERMREVVETSMQMHGGIAFTWESTIHVLARRGLLSRQTLGDEHEQLSRIAAERVGGSQGREQELGLPR